MALPEFLEHTAADREATGVEQAASWCHRFAAVVRPVVEPNVA